MKIQYLGTAAAEGVPALFCECERCKRSRLLGGRNIRTRSQALVDDRILIDFPPDTFVHFLRYDLPLHLIKTCLITHAHSDHLYAEDLEFRKNGSYAQLNDRAPITFYSDTRGYEMIRAVIDGARIPDTDLRAERISPFQPFDVEGYHVTPVRAAHDPKSEPLLFVLEKDGKSLFYANDSSEYCEETFRCLEGLGHPLTVISLDCTDGNGHGTYMGHLNLNRCKALRETLFARGIADKNTIFVLNHFSHNGLGCVYDDFAPLAESQGFLTTYDGMTLEF